MSITNNVPLSTVSRETYEYGYWNDNYRSAYAEEHVGQLVCVRLLLERSSASSECYAGDFRVKITDLDKSIYGDEGICTGQIELESERGDREKFVLMDIGHILVPGTWWPGNCRDGYFPKGLEQKEAAKNKTAIDKKIRSIGFGSGRGQPAPSYSTI